jgi:hypothetical protein
MSGRLRFGAGWLASKAKLKASNACSLKTVLA